MLKGAFCEKIIILLIYPLIAWSSTTSQIGVPSQQSADILFFSALLF